MRGNGPIKMIHFLTPGNHWCLALSEMNREIPIITFFVCQTIHIYKGERHTVKP